MPINKKTFFSTRPSPTTHNLDARFTQPRTNIMNDFTQPMLLFFRMSDKERRQMEVRERLEKEAGGKRKKGFMTPERKKKLRVSEDHGFI